MPDYKSNADIQNLPKQTRDTMEASTAYKKGKGGSGIGISKMIEPYPEFAFADGEKMYKNGNSYIMFGRDRPASKLSGYGGRGDTSAS